MKIRLCAVLLTAIVSLTAYAQRPDTLWYRYDNRFTPNKAISIADYDTIEFKSTMMVLSKPDGQPGKKNQGYMTTTPGVFMFTNPGRILYKPWSMNVDFTNPNSQWCFERSKESDHFVLFWEKGATGFDAATILNIAENCWKVYTTKLGFLKEGESSTDTYKIILRVYNQTDWLASGSGEDMKVGTLNLCPWAATSRGGMTVAHEIGHTFQYLTNVDCGANNVHGFNYGLGDNGAGGNGFWEDCANWMAYKVYTDRQFTDGEYFEGYMARCHQNLMHEDSRYHNCFYQDYLCQLYGQDIIGRLWREAIRPEDPVEALMRLEGLSTTDFARVMYDCFAHMCTWDIDGVRKAAAHRVGAHGNYLSSKSVDGEEWFQVDSAHCPQNYGYNITRLKVPTAGTEIKIRFSGIAGEAGYRSVNKARAGWRWGVVTQLSDGTTVYGDMQTSKNASVDETTVVVPEGASKMWLVVMGAPTQWWHHLWDDNPANDEQWPYRVQLEGTRPYGSFKTYKPTDFPDDYARHDTTIVYNAELAYSSSSYTSVRVQYDMDAISEALGVSTALLRATKVGAAYSPRFVGVSSSGAVTNNTTTSTSSSTCFGHWFTTAGNVCGYDSSAAIFAEMYPDAFGCYVGQYPGRLKAGNTYTIRQAVLYKAADGKTYRATNEVHLRVF